MLYKVVSPFKTDKSYQDVLSCDDVCCVVQGGSRHKSLTSPWMKWEGQKQIGLSQNEKRGLFKKKKTEKTEKIFNFFKCFSCPQTQFDGTFCLPVAFRSFVGYPTAEPLKYTEVWLFK